MLNGIPLKVCDGVVAMMAVALSDTSHSLSMLLGDHARMSLSASPPPRDITGRRTGVQELQRGGRKVSTVRGDVQIDVVGVEVDVVGGAVRSRSC